MPRAYLPVGEQLRSATRDARDPVCRPPKMATQLLVFLLGPEDQISVQFAHCRVKRRAIISPVVLDPASDNWNEHPRQILDRFIAALRQLPATKFVTNGLRCPPHHSICMAPRVRRKRGRLPSNGFIERAPQRPACLHLCHEGAPPIKH